MKRILLLLSCFALLQSCQADDAQAVNETANEPVAIEFESIFRHKYAYTNETPGLHVVNDEAAWDEFSSAVNSPFFYDAETGETYSQLESLEIDFTSYTVIAAVDERHSYGGYDISITSIVQDNNQVIVEAQATSMGDGAVTAAETQPVHIVKIPKTTLPVTFEIN